MKLNLELNRSTANLLIVAIAAIVVVAIVAITFTNVSVKKTSTTEVNASK